MASPRVSTSYYPVQPHPRSQTLPIFGKKLLPKGEQQTTPHPKTGLLNKLGKWAAMLAVMLPLTGPLASKTFAAATQTQSTPQKRYVHEMADTLEEHFTVTGELGPYNPGVLGGYGRNAASRYNWVERISGLKYTASAATMRYTPDNSTEEAKLNNAFGYTQEMNRKFPVDANRDGKINLREMKSAFNGNEQAAKAFIQLLDRPSSTGTKDGFIDASEQTALLLFQDNATQLLLKKARQVQQKVLNKQARELPRYAVPEARLFFAEAPHWLNKYDSKPDGLVDGGERYVANFAAVHMPTLTGMILDDLHQALQLETKAHAFHQAFLKDLEKVPLYH